MVLAMSAGALRKLCCSTTGRADHPLFASVPVSTDNSPDRISGNYFDGVMVVSRSSVADPLARVRATSPPRSSQGERPPWAANSSTGGRPICRLCRRRRLFGWLAASDAQNKVFNVPVSNVPGPRDRGRVAGATVTEFYSVGPLSPGSGMNITVWSYVDQLNISVLSDDADNRPTRM